MKNVLLAVMVLAVFGLAIHYALTVPFLYIYLPLAGWGAIPAARIFSDQDDRRLLLSYFRLRLQPIV